METSHDPAPAVDPSILLPNLIRYCLPEGPVTNFTLDAAVLNARFPAQQILRCLEFESMEFHMTLTKSGIARAFEVDHCAVKRALQRSYENLPAPGRHRELSVDKQQALVSWISEKAQENKAVNRTELSNYCIARFGSAITRGWVNSFLSRHRGKLFETKSVPQEDSRLRIPCVLLEVAIEGILIHIQGTCVELVSNLDEVGRREWEDRVERKLIVPNSMIAQIIFMVSIAD